MRALALVLLCVACGSEFQAAETKVDPAASAGAAVTATGGTATGGVATGGQAIGGSATGGTATGGTATGGTATGGTATGGTATGGTATGGTPTGGHATGGTATGGTATGGVATGGTFASLCTTGAALGQSDCPNPCKMQVNDQLCTLTCNTGTMWWACLDYYCADESRLPEPLRTWTATKC